MQIYVNNKLAALKKGTSFEYVSENRMFSGSDGYTLTITFPLKDCPQNLAIFGHINRPDVAAGKVVFDCEIRDKGFYKFGCITVTEINEAEVKTQFLDGRSEQNFDKTLDKIYINELDLGRPNTVYKTAITPEEAWSPISNPNFVALPWVNDYSGNIQNKANCVIDDTVQDKYHFEWDKDTTGLSWQPYLLYITKKICEAIGYEVDFSAWEAHEEYRYLLICNTLPHAWYLTDFARALPHWTVEEYFEKLELFLQGEFTLDHRGKRVAFNFTKAVLNATAPIALNNVIEEHSTEVKVEDEQCEYSEMKNLVYKECDHDTWKYYSCDWFIKGQQWNVERYNSLKELLAAERSHATWDGRRGRGYRPIDRLLYAADVDAYFIVQTISRTPVSFNNFRWTFKYKCRLRPVNLFGGRIVNDEEDADQDEIEFIPVRVDDTDATFGRLMFLNFNGYDEDNTEGEDDSKYPFLQSHTVETLKAGEKEKKAEYYDCIYVAWWDGALRHGHQLPHPIVEDIEIADDWSNFTQYHFSLRINELASRSGGFTLDPKQKTTFKWLSDSIPDVRAVFHIRGKRFLAEKITATFTENGMSQVLKGVFYPIED